MTLTSQGSMRLSSLSTLCYLYLMTKEISQVRCSCGIQPVRLFSHFPVVAGPGEAVSHVIGLYSWLVSPVQGFSRVAFH